MKRRQKTTIMSAIIGCLGIGLIGVALWFYQKNNQYNTYVQDRHGFSIKYPRDWEIIDEHEVPEVIVLFKSPRETELDTFQENVNIVVQDLSKPYSPKTMDDYTAMAIKQMEVVFEKNLEVLESDRTSLGGKLAHRFVFIGTGPDVELKMMVVWTVSGLKAYQITYTAYAIHFDKYVGKVNKMLKSFKTQ